MTLEDAVSLAALAHRGQVDKAGAPYILHPLRVMLRLASERERMAAVLHDVVEDTEVSLEYLRSRGCPEDVVEALDLLTRRNGEEYRAFILRLIPNPLARKVKIADLEDNMDASRFADPNDISEDRMARYREALAMLKEGVSGR